MGREVRRGSNGPRTDSLLARGSVTHAYATTLNSTRLKMYLSEDAVSSTARVVDCFVCSAGKARFLKLWQRLGEGAECLSRDELRTSLGCLIVRDSSHVNIWAFV